MPSGKHQQPKDEPCNRINIIFSATLCSGHFSNGPDSSKSVFSSHNFSGHMCSPDGSMSTPNPSGANLLKLHNDVQTCGYEDVQVMWEILRRSESELMASHPKRKQRPFWRVFVWSNHSAASSFSANHS
ncbi:hypothetical protein D5086_000329 [Populus alba]|uniref:Uncharacterized protein n=1 Tax=Populus alba TaxID=43335 RepID=A0ACC4CWY9_POPAL